MYLVAVELKIGDFKAVYKGQGTRRWPDKHEAEPAEPPSGVRTLSTGKKSEQIELLELDKPGIYVAEHLISLPPCAMLVERLKQITQRHNCKSGRECTNENMIAKTFWGPFYKSYLLLLIYCKFVEVLSVSNAGTIDHRSGKTRRF